MALKYCVKCQVIIDDEALNSQTKTLCPTCKEGLMYFGREDVVLSTQEVLDAYDDTHLYNPVQDYQGIHKQVPKQMDPVALLECEDILANEPMHQGALLFLGKHCYSERAFERSKLLFESLVKIDPGTDLYYRYLADITYHLGNYKACLIHLQYLSKQSVLKSQTQEKQGIVYLKMSQYKKSLDAFILAHQQAEEGQRKDFLIKVIQSLMVYCNENNERIK
ncbi:MAG: hypothetical protein CL521_05635 [Actinobacteria bacterium]|nr:hypothetical protein [Actinomycetota bacterium]|tara:strand:- start:229 stop:891 length:663 start_codon:yes stop_codon:yes gene_type:complete